jgi:hypothetical protein
VSLRPAARAGGAALLAIPVWPGPAAAHAFGARYDLPLPLWLYLTGAGGAVALTFVLLILFARGRSKSLSRSRLELCVPVRSSVCRITQAVAGIVSLGLFFLVLITGLFGVQDAIHNFAPTFVWVIWWVGFTFFVALLGNVWRVVNPWSVVFDGVSYLIGRAALKNRDEGEQAQELCIGAWTSVVLLLIFAWVELVSSIGENPRTLAFLILGYSVLTWSGMAAFGRAKWLNRGEVFHQYFGILGRFGALGSRAGNVVARYPGSGLLTSGAGHFSRTAFVVLMLSIVTFDGFVETPVWAGFIDWLSQDMTVRPLLLWLQSAGVDLLAAIKTAGLIIFPFLFMLVFLAFCVASRAMAGDDVSIYQLANALVLSLVPIAIAYHISHYLSYLLLAGQLIIPLASDPFGWDWDLFGTASRPMDIGIINAATVWYVAVVAIVIGHVIAVWLAHETALALYKNARHALLSQVPMLILMVLYTMTSLWILSQPIVTV